MKRILILFLLFILDGYGICSDFSLTKPSGSSGNGNSSSSVGRVDGRGHASAIGVRMYQDEKSFQDYLRKRDQIFLDGYRAANASILLPIDQKSIDLIQDLEEKRTILTEQLGEFSITSSLQEAGADTSLGMAKKIDQQKLDKATDCLQKNREYYFFTERRTLYGEKLSRALDRRNMAVENINPDMTIASHQRYLLSVTDITLETADEYYYAQLYEEGDIAVGYGEALLDVITGITPGISLGRDLYESITGKSLITGKDLSEAERTFSIIGSVTGGLSSSVARSLKIFKQIFSSKKVLQSRIFGNSMRRVESFSEVAVRGEKYSPIQRGPLHDIPIGELTVADTFRSGTYITYRAEKPLTLYRVQSAPHQTGGRMGRYWTTEKPYGPVQSIIDSALDPILVDNKAIHWIQIEVPAGHTVHEGVAAAQRGLVGGGNQTFLSEVLESWIVRQGKF